MHLCIMQAGEKMQNRYYKTYYVYIVEGKKSSGEVVYYTGLTDNLSRRTHEHWNGIRSNYMIQQKIKPQKIVYIERCNRLSIAKRRQKQIKTMWKPDKLKMIQWKQTEHCREIIKLDNFKDMRLCQMYSYYVLGARNRGVSCLTSSNLGRKYRENARVVFTAVNRSFCYPKMAQKEKIT